MKRDEKTEAKKVIITAAVVGSRTSRSQNPNVPISPEEIAKMP